jgi:hypothetical protein
MPSNAYLEKKVWGIFRALPKAKLRGPLFQKCPGLRGLHICKEVGRGDFQVREDGEGFSKWEKLNKKKKYSFAKFDKIYFISAWRRNTLGPKTWPPYTLEKKREVCKNSCYYLHNEFYSFQL